MRRTFVLGVLLFGLFTTRAHAQLPIQISLKGGATVPLHGEGDAYENGVHLAVGAKLPLIPLQFEGAYDKMTGEGINSDFKALSGGIAIPITVTPPLLPVSAYLIVGGGLYKWETGASVTDFGANAGAGVRFGIPGSISLFGEGRGVAIFADANKITYAQIAVGVRF